MTRISVHAAVRYVAAGSAALWLAAAAAPLYPGLRAQAPPASVDAVATDPIQCWWKSGRTAVHVGERFPLMVTCSFVDAGAVRVVVDESRLDPAAVKLAPFDVVGGVRHPDIPAGSRRFVQYEYSLRILGDGLFGRDVAVPAFDVGYRVQSTEGQATVESMQRVYRLPALPVRVAALVAPQADDIRETPGVTFGAVERRRFRGNVAFAAAALLFSASFGCAVAAAGGVLRRRRTPSAARLLSERGILRGAIRELEEIEREAARTGWTGALVGRALAAVRIGAALALGQQVAQTEVAESEGDREGALLLERGTIRRTRLMVWAPVTADAPTPVQGPLAELTAARYTRGDRRDGERLDRALADALTALRRLRAEQSWRVMPRRRA